MQANKQQQRAIAHNTGPALILAGPGSGKTFTTVERVRYLIEVHHADPSHILVITFTKAAARQMRDRFFARMDNQFFPVTFGTFHAVFFHILKTSCHYNGSSILKEKEKREYLRAALLTLPKKFYAQNDGKMDQEWEQGLLSEIGFIKNIGKLPADFTSEYVSRQEFMRIFVSFQKQLAQEKKLDLDDFAAAVCHLFRTNPAELARWQREYSYLLVDEFQDINAAQYEAVKLLCGGKRNLFVVGDDDQSIYAFRGAKPEIMLNFQKEYPKSKMVKMSTNYRSGKKIISEADRVIKSNTNRFQKDFIGFKPENGAVEYIVTEEKKDEILKIYSRIKKLLNDGENPADIAVLFRTNRQAEKMAAILFRNQIPFQSNEKIQSKYEHWMFQDLQAYYRLANKHLDNKSSDARRDLSRVLNHPNRYLFGYDYIVHGLNRRAMKATVYAKEKEPWKLNAAEGNIDLFFMLLKNLRGKKPSDFLRSLYSIGKYKKYLEDYADFRNMEVRDLSSIWKEYQHDASTYNDWVEWGKYIVKYNKELKETLKNKDGIMLSTMHGSKGLEWKHVFIIDCVEGVCPSPKAETAEELEEERRLFYVAMTRAKEHLYLCYYKAEEGKTVVASPYIM